MTTETTADDRRNMTREERIAAWQERKAARVERLRQRAEALRVEADARFNSTANKTLISMGGEPIKIGHHSERRHRALFDRAHNDMRKGCEALSEAKRCERAAESAESNDAISSRDPEAIDRLRAKLADCERLQDAMKKANVIIRKHKSNPEAAIPGLMALGLTESRARDAFKRDFAGRIGFPDYALKNNNAEIRRLKDRIATLERAATVEDQTHAGNGCEVTITAEDGPVMIRVRHDSKPPEAVRSALKMHGFRWVPSQGWWHAQDGWGRKEFAIGLTRGE